MKTRWIILAVALFGLSGVAFQRASAEYAYSAGVEVRDWSDFYEPLAPYGHWVRVESYGWCWYPAYVESDWRPYTNGDWMWTEDGWYWMSEEPWAWATYHYGRWVWDSYYGWLWVPGAEWAPAWVAWREGSDYVGWAPLPPSCDFGPQGTTIYAEQVVYAPNTFVFVERRHFCEPIRPSVLIVNQTIVNQTVNVTKIQRVNQLVVNHGPRVDEIQRVAKRVPFAQTKDLRTDRWSSRRRDVPAPRERVDWPRDERVVKPQPQSPKRDFDREIPVVRALDRSRDARPMIVSAKPPQVPDASDFVRPRKRDFPPVAPNPRGNDDRSRNEVSDHVKPQREVAQDRVAAPTPVGQSVSDNGRHDSGKMDARRGRDIDDDSPRNRHRN